MPSLLEDTIRPPTRPLDFSLLRPFCFPFTCQHTRSLPESSRVGQRVLQKHRFAEVTPSPCHPVQVQTKVDL